MRGLTLIDLTVWPAPPAVADLVARARGLVGVLWGVTGGWAGWLLGWRGWGRCPHIVGMGVTDGAEGDRAGGVA